MAARGFGTCVAGSRSGSGGAFVVVTCNAVIFWEREEEVEVEVTEAKKGIVEAKKGIVEAKKCIVGFERGQRQHRRG